MNVGCFETACFGFGCVGAGQIGFLNFITGRFDTGCFGVCPKKALSKIGTERGSLIPKGNRFHNRIPPAKTDHAENTHQDAKKLPYELSDP
jgi:hypothetical protein